MYPISPTPQHSLPSTTSYPAYYDNHSSGTTSGAVNHKGGVLVSKTGEVDKTLKGYIRDALSKPTLPLDYTAGLVHDYTSGPVKTSIIEKAMQHGYLDEINRILRDIGETGEEVDIPEATRTELGITVYCDEQGIVGIQKDGYIPPTILSATMTSGSSSASSVSMSTSSGAKSKTTGTPSIPISAQLKNFFGW